MFNKIRTLFAAPPLPQFEVESRSVETPVQVKTIESTYNKPIKRRSFNAGNVGLKTASWVSQDISLNTLLESQLSIIRARSRELARNTSTGRRFISLVKDNIVGSDGFILQSRCGDYVNGKWVLDDLANQTIEAHYKIWCESEHCDITGQSSLTEITRLITGEGLARDGEFLVREIVGSKETPYRYQLQVLNIDRLDINKRGNLPNGNTIRMGVERNSAGKPVAYYVLEHNPHDHLNLNSQVHTRIDATEIIHRFVRIDPEQVRGVPWAHAIMTGQNMLNMFEEAAVEASVVGATNMGFFKKPAPGEPGYSTPNDGDLESMSDGEDVDGNLYQDAVGASFREMPNGWDLQQFNPTYPHATFDPFVQARKRDIASGLDVTHHSLSGDLSGVNFSSARIGDMGERSSWKVGQKFVARIFTMRTTKRWLEISLLAGALKMPNGSALPATKLEKFKAGLSFTARGWDWTDPLKEAAAAKVSVQEGFATRTQIVASKGGDFEENVIELAREKALCEKHGVTLGEIDKKLMGSVATDKDDDEDDGVKDAK
jgi:lambda family phage portal protein